MDDLKREMSFLSIWFFAGLFRAKSAPTADRLEMDDLKREMNFLSIWIFAWLFKAKSAHTADRLENGRLEKGNELSKYLIFRRII